MIKLTAPEGKKILDIRTGKAHQEIVCDEKDQKYFAVADSDEQFTMEQLQSGSSMAERLESIENELTATKILLGVE